MTGGHGHVTPNSEGTRARCGGPGICKACSLELARFVNTHGRVPDHMVKPIPDKVVVNGVTYTKENKHPFYDAACKASLPSQPDLFADQQCDKTERNLRMRFPDNFRASPFHSVKDEGRKLPVAESIQIEAFPDENLASPITFSKQCFQFCGDACNCGKREFMNSYAEPYLRDDSSPQE